MRNKTLVFLLFILLIASFFRLWQLDTIPSGLYPDEAINGNEALSNPGKVFYPENNGREGLFINLIALSFSIFGISIFSLKIVPAIIGILTVLGLYLLTKELLSQAISYPEREQASYGAGKLQATNIALLSSFFLAISFWHINFSRIGFRAILLPFISVFAFYFLLKGFRLKRISDFIISGIFFGLGFYTYISYRFIVLLILVVLISFWFIYQKQKLIRNFTLYASYFIALVFILALPIGIYFLQNPQDFMSRAGPISIFVQDNPVKAFLISFVSHLGMFNFSGDFNWRHNFSGSPQLLWPIGILFLIGFFFSVKELINSLKQKNWSLGIGHWSLVSWFFIMLLPGILTFEGIPHALRVIGVIPAVYIFAGIGGWLAYGWLEKIVNNKKISYILCSIFLILVASASFNKYFFQWAQNPNIEGAFTKKFVEVGYLLNSLPSEVEKYVIVNEAGVPVPFPDGIPMPAQTVILIENTKFSSPRSVYLLPENIDQIKIEKKGVIVPMKYDKDLFSKFQEKFPEGEIQKKDEVWIYQIDG